MTLSRRRFGRLTAASALAGAAPLPAFAGLDDKNPINVTVTGATVRGYPKLVVEGLNAVLREAYPGSAITFKPGSPAGGVQEVADGRAHFTATASATEIRLGLAGQEPFKAPLAGKIAFVMMLHEQQMFHFVMTKAWADENGIRTWDDIAKKKPKMRLAINGLDNPQTNIGAPYEVFKVHGFTVDDVKKWGGSLIIGNSGIGLDALQDGKADAFMNARFPADATVRDVSNKRPLLWIDGDPAKVKQAAENQGYKLHMVPKGMYPFVDKDMPTIMQWTSVVAGAAVADELVYKFVRGIAEGHLQVQKIHKSLAAFAPKEMVRNPANLPFHPAAAKYYKEKGLI
jgi:hypothetical protein